MTSVRPLLGALSHSAAPHHHVLCPDTPMGYRPPPPCTPCRTHPDARILRRGPCHWGVRCWPCRLRGGMPKLRRQNSRWSNCQFRSGWGRCRMGQPGVLRLLFRPDRQSLLQQEDSGLLWERPWRNQHLYVARCAVLRRVSAIAHVGDPISQGFTCFMFRDRP